jgi:hypothetical protein
MPIPIPGTDLSIVCFGVRNTSMFDSRITAIGLELPGEKTGFSLISANLGFDLIEQVSHVPELPGVTLDFALVTGRTFGGGRPNAGLAPAPIRRHFASAVPFRRVSRLRTCSILTYSACSASAPTVTWVTLLYGRAAHCRRAGPPRRCSPPSATSRPRPREESARFRRRRRVRLEFRSARRLLFQTAARRCIVVVPRAEE